MLRQRVPLLAVVLLLACFALYAEAGRGSGGTYSLPTGNPVTSGTVITSSWANSTLGDISTELTNSLDRYGRGGMLAALQLSNGTAASPGLTFSSEPVSGIYRNTTNDLRLSVASTDIMRWQTSAVTSFQPLTVTGRTTTSNLTVTGTSEALTISPSTANTTGLTVSGVGSGNGVVANSGTTAGAIAVSAVANGTSGVGVRALGNGSGEGLVIFGGGTANTAGARITSQGSGGTGLVVTAGGGGNAYGLTSTGSGNLSGIYSTGGASGGSGATIFGGAASGAGVIATGGAPNGVGLSVFGNGAGAGGQFSAGTAATGAARTDALKAVNGDLNLDGVARPTSTTALKNRVTPLNIVKAYGSSSITGTVFTTSDSMNVSSFVASKGYGASSCFEDTVTVTFAQPFASSAYIVTLTGYPLGINPLFGAVTQECMPMLKSKSAGSFSFHFINPTNGQMCMNGGGACASAGGNGGTWAGVQFDFMAIGEQ